MKKRVTLIKQAVIVGMFTLIFGTVDARTLYTHYIVNDMPHAVNVSVKYKLCPDKKCVLQPGQTHTMGAGLCPLVSIKAEHAVTKAAAHSYEGPFVGNGTWRVTDKNGFRVIKEKIKREGDMHEEE